MYKKYQLKNGLTVLLVESHKSPVVSVQMWVRTGSADEQKGEEGLSHFIEHLVFKGTNKFGVGEIASTVEGSGGQLNAYTSFDQTVFYVTISKNFASTGLEAVAEMMGFPTFDAKEIDNEREVVIEEIKRGQDNPQRQASRQLFSTIYKKHPYRLPVIGFAENIKTVSRDKILKYFHSRYVPENMTLLLVGDFTSADMRVEVKKYFEGFQPYKLKKVKRPQELKQKAPRISVQKSNFKECLFYLSWPLPSAKHKDIPAIDVLSLILGQGDSSRLTTRVKLEKGLVNYVGASSFTPQDQGFLTVSASTSFERLEAALEEIGEVILEFIKNPPTDDEMYKALVNFNSDEFYSLETVDGMASKFGTYEHLFRDFRYFKEFMKQINQLTAQDIQRITRKYLTPEGLNLVLMSPESELQGKKILEKFKTQFLKKLKKELKAQKQKASNKKARIRWSAKASTKAPKAQDQTEILSLPGGATAYLRPSYETNVVSMRMAFHGGVRIEPEGQLGLTELLGRTWGRTVKGYDENTLSEKIEAMASSLSAFAGRNTAGLSLSTLSPFLNPMFELFEKTVLEPTFEAAVVAREKTMMLEYLKRREDNPAQIASLHFHRLIFGSHPYAKDLIGTEQSLNSINPDDVAKQLRRMLFSANMKIVLNGNFDRDEWREKLKNFARHLSPGQELKTTFTVRANKDTQKHYIESKKEQSHIIVGYPGLTFTSEDRYALQVMEAILAGQGGRLFLELRDKESLAYSVSPLRMEGIDAGYFAAYIGCSPEKGEKAIQMMKSEFSKLQAVPISKEELERSKRYLIGRHDIDLQKTSSVGSAILFDAMYGLDANEPFLFAEKINKVTVESVQAVAKKILSQPETVICVGPQPAWAEKTTTTAKPKPLESNQY